MGIALIFLGGWLGGRFEYGVIGVCDETSADCALEAL